jgi:hypothetical protein
MDSAYEHPAVHTRRLSPRRVSVPKPLLATVAATLATAWIFPALSHQWQDRQKAKELTAGLVTQIGSDTSAALVTSSFLTNNRFRSSGDSSRPGFNQDVFNRLYLEWRTSAAEVEAQLQAYYPNAVVEEWRDYSALVWGTYRLVTDNKSARPGTVKRLRELFKGDVPGWYIDKMERPWIDRIDPNARAAYFYVSQAVLARRTVVIDEMLSSRPAGFSTRPSDLLRDLVPGL